MSDCHDQGFDNGASFSEVNSGVKTKISAINPRDLLAVCLAVTTGVFC
jgi:hypothetical protein